MVKRNKNGMGRDGTHLRCDTDTDVNETENPARIQPGSPPGVINQRFSLGTIEGGQGMNNTEGGTNGQWSCNLERGAGW